MIKVTNTSLSIITEEELEICKKSITEKIKSEENQYLQDMENLINVLKAKLSKK